MTTETFGCNQGIHNGKSSSKVKIVIRNSREIWNTAKTYIGVKEIKAIFMTLGDYNYHRGWKMPENENPSDPGYIIQYPDGYISWSPKEQFELAYMTVGDLDYSAALFLLKQGKKVARAGWKGRGMWVSMTEGKTLDMAVDDIWTQNVKDIAISNSGIVEILPYLVMKTADCKLQIGWVPSQGDMQATDWRIEK